MIMFKTALRRILRSHLGAPAVILPRPGRFVGRARVCDAFDPMALTFRMGAGFAGEVNRKHPFEVEAGLMDPTNPVTMYGQACVVDSVSKKIRRVIATDTGLIDLYGISVRPFPFQDGGAAGAFGAQTLGAVTVPPTNQPIDVLRSGYILVPIVGAPGKGDPVNVWVALASGAHLQGGFEQTATGGSTVLITPAGTYSTTFNGPPDPNGIGELIFRA